MFELDTTVSPLAFAPDTDQPAPARSSVLTGSSKVTRIFVSEVALASSMRGAWPSATRCRSDVDGPAALPYASVSCVWSTVSQAVSLAAARSLPPNVSTCTVPLPFPENRSGAPRSPPLSNSRPAYADAPA